MLGGDTLRQATGASRSRNDDEPGAHDDQDEPPGRRSACTRCPLHATRLAQLKSTSSCWVETTGWVATRCRKGPERAPNRWRRTRRPRRPQRPPRRAGRRLRVAGRMPLATRRRPPPRQVGWLGTLGGDTPAPPAPLAAHVPRMRPATCTRSTYARSTPPPPSPSPSGTR